MFVNQCLYSQVNVEKEEFALDVAYKYTPLNPSFYNLLDTLSNGLCNCVFNALERDYFFDITIFEDNKISGQIYPYLSYPSWTFNPIDVYRNAKKANKGFFYYNGKLVLVEFKGDHWYQLKIEQYFSRSYCMEAIMFSVPAETFPEVGMGLDALTMRGLYDPTKGKLKITESHKCTGEKYYSYTIQEGDTWESVAGKFATTVENIRTLNGKYDEREEPEKGHYILVYYKIVDGILTAKREGTRLDP